MNKYVEEDTAQGEVDLSCVFPFEDGYGVHNGCRELDDWENEEIEDTNYKVTICYSNLALNLFQFICHTDVDQGGLGKAYNWGWCGEGCPLEHVNANTTWGTDETLTVTTEVVMKIDPDIYKAMIGLVILAIALVIMAGLVRFGGNVILQIIWIKSFLKYLFYCRKEDISSDQTDHYQDQRR